eukprot:GEMP01019487.1.p1 GENE.GEMP01019487.1~~GEMP01019487.1.p1  ORF type:complete len:358 (+),score=61.99 GEMP01019487.1:148-1221(+)
MESGVSLIGTKSELNEPSNPGSARGLSASSNPGSARGFNAPSNPGSARGSVSSAAKYATMLERRLDQIRHEILEYRNDAIPDIHFVIAGPTGTGKSSLIRTWYRALQNTADLSAELKDYTVVKNSSQCEGTMLFKSVEIKSGRELPGKPTSAIFCHDSRGQVFLDAEERKQLELMMSGKVLDNALVEQRQYRHVHLLWEFWKRSEDLWPSEIINRSMPIAMHGLLLLFDGTDKEPVSASDASFYRPFITRCCNQGYMPIVVLTRIDEVERIPIPPNAQDDRDLIMSTRFDERIDQVCRSLLIPRRSVYFIENYHGPCSDPEKSASIDFHSLKLLKRLCEIMEEQTITVKKGNTCSIQ